MHQYVENDQQYKITERWMRRFQSDLAALQDHPDPLMHPLLYQALIDQNQGMISEMSAALEAYQSRQQT